MAEMVLSLIIIIWHDDYNERVKRNIPLDSIKSNIAKILDRVEK